MKLGWGALSGIDALRSLPEALETLGFDTLSAIETQHDPFIQSAILSEHSNRAEIMTTIAVAFARTPALLAYAAHDLNALSGGRFILGLGTQTKAHITRRFTMPWSDPALRMKEIVRAIHAIWDCWYDGEPLDFRGQYYALSLMTPNFAPNDIAFGRPPIHLAAVGPQMTETTVEVADGLICHTFTTERYLREVTLPAVTAGLERHGKRRADFEITGIPLIAAGRTDETQQVARDYAKKQIAFYGSTPAYRGVLDLHGWSALHDDLHRLSKRGRWDEMADLISDDILGTFAVMGTPHEAAHALGTRFDGLFDRVSLGFGNDLDLAAELHAALKS